MNEYAAGVGLAPHIDTHSAFGPTLLSVSLAGHAVMEFRLHDDSETESENNNNNNNNNNGHAVGLSAQVEST